MQRRCRSTPPTRSKSVSGSSSEPTGRTLAVTGGTGFLGSHVVATARARGHRVRMLVRDPAKAVRVRHMFGLEGDDGIEVVSAVLTDPASVGAAIGGCDAIVHVAALFSLDPRHGDEMLRVNPAMSRAIISASIDAELDAIVCVSTLGVYQPPPAPFVDASMPPSAGVGPYSRSKIAAEAIAREAQDAGHPVVTVYPGGIFGPNDPNPTLSDSVAVVRDILRWRLPTIPQGAVMPFIDVRDVAALCVSATAPGRGPRRYLAAGWPTELRDVVRMCAALTGRWLPMLPVSRGVLDATGRLADAVALRTNRQLPVSAETVAFMAVGLDHPDARYDQRPATDDFGVPSIELRTTLRDTILWLAEAGHLTQRHLGALGVEATH